MESLPNQFVSAMRTLFDIMDDKHTGYVKLVDIENRWRDDRTKGLPRGVIESLQKVASPDGRLTFDRFCTGLKICLLKNQVETASNKVERQNIVDTSDVRLQIKSSVQRPPSSASLLDINETKSTDRNWDVVNLTENSAQHRTVSMPQLIRGKDLTSQENVVNNSHSGINKQEATTQNRILGPPKPPRLEKLTSEMKGISHSEYKSERVIALDSEDTIVSKLDYNEMPQEVQEQSRDPGDGRSSNETQSITRTRRSTRRREPRRHTLQNGVDYNLLKRMKQIEQEKDVLLQGLSAVEEAREWYLNQITEVQEKMRYAGRMGAYVEPWSEANQERLELLRARVVELNRQLRALAVGWKHGPLSLHMNLALPVAPPTANTASTHVTVLRSQNRMLTEEVNRKNERISLLEREKSALIRELLHQRNRLKLMDDYS